MQNESNGYAKEWLTKEEWNMLLDAPSSYDYYQKPEFKKWRDELMMKLMYQAALRVSEATDLQYPYNFTKEEGQAYVYLNPEEETVKTERELQPISSQTFRDVANFMTAFHEEKETNFVLQITRQTAWRRINKLAKNVGIEKQLGTHTLRRSRAKHLLESENDYWDIQNVSDFLRHDNIQTTREYLKISKKDMAKQMEKTDNEEGLN